MNFLFIKGCSADDVRIAKWMSCLRSMGHAVSFWGWNRMSPDDPCTGQAQLTDCRYLYQGGGYGRHVAWRYPIWMTKLFFFALLSKEMDGKKVVVVNFDAALPVSLACWLRGRKYVYEILDEFAISYHFPCWLQSFVRWIDHAIIRKAQFVIHVDINRVTYLKEKSIVIENAPEDYWGGAERSYSNMRMKFAVVGNLSMGRGIASICAFARSHPDTRLLVVGTCFDDDTERCLRSLSNVERHECMQQRDLFRIMVECCAIFSLYDPSLQINRLAASNKVYDAMMMGIPVITNAEVLNSSFIRGHDFGFVVNYGYGKTWDVLSSTDFIDKCIQKGKRGRALYLKHYQFHAMIKQRFLPKFSIDGREKEKNMSYKERVRYAADRY